MEEEIRRRCVFLGTKAIEIIAYSATQEVYNVADHARVPNDTWRRPHLIDEPGRDDADSEPHAVESPH